MSIYGYPLINIITPRKPYTVDLSQTDPTYNTYYTLLNITSGLGKINRILAHNYRDNTYQDASNITIQVTVDGTAYTLNRSGYNTSLIGGVNLAGGANANSNARGVFYYLGEINFFNSLKIEIKDTSNATLGSNANISAVVDYKLV